MLGGVKIYYWKVVHSKWYGSNAIVNSYCLVCIIWNCMEIIIILFLNFNNYLFRSEILKERMRTKCDGARILFTKHFKIK